MNDNTNIDEIFEAIEEINLLSETRKKNKEILILDKNAEIITKPRVSKEKKIPLETEELIKQAENQLNLIKEK
jgi:hypothetical protein|tara:strand:- start:90 stop:308 length:219 start_codon:yes stop_codon:yes gene_type:complete